MNWRERPKAMLRIQAEYQAAMGGKGDDLDPIDSHPFQADPSDPSDDPDCVFVEDGEMCIWPRRDHLT